MFEKLNKNLIPIAIVIAGVLIAGAVVFVNTKEDSSFTVISPQEAAEKAINFFNENMLAEGYTASLTNVTEESGLYRIQLDLENEEHIFYITKDGKIFFLEGINIEEALAYLSEEPKEQEIEKRDRLDVKLFVMSYCPYGLQAQKMFLPVYDLLKDKADMGVYFVNYIMHEKEEIDENLRQYCIQKEEENEKYYSYLSCFVKDGDFEKCLSEAEIDMEKLNSCIAQTDEDYKITQSYNDETTWLSGYYPKFDVHTDLNEKYGVQGSPTIVINDTVVDINPRSPENFKQVICQSFNLAPEECSQTLSEEIPSPGFGEGTSSSEGGECQ